MKKRGSATEPLWYKDAVIYELHVRAFADSNNDGIGDFQGLISRLDYLQDLGVTCIWILPFFPSPLRDDGYDIAEYNDVNPAYGTLADFKQFLNAAHQRNMQVMIELVINHTSDQHPWFQAARLAPPGSPEREMYVWSETDKKYDGVRIIFTDTEKSNWTWDDTAKAFYWHRFFSHQPDLNFDNPRVMEEVLSAMRFWLDMGVDALRLDAIPYLIERDGTNCENVPETHVKIKAIRAALDAEYEDRLILAEANMWPADVRPYFGDGDECHMAFHFPLMPRIYMALRQEDRLPITDIMAQTPAIPENCQWGLFLRNHDELTLEMVTDDERDYMYLAYSADPRMRINVGIRRRLAPLVDNNRRRIELLNSLLLSFPGTPIMYYGDEIGMGDNIYLGDRNGVRTPMQWNSDRNAGFSKCDPARLYFPVVMDPIYGYQVVNVEAQLSDQSSLLHWTRNMIALRKLFQVFGRGSLEFLQPENRKVLAYLRKLKREDGTFEIVLCCANLSRFAQPVSLDLAEYAGCKPMEMLGYVPFPPITEQPYPLTVAPYSFLWFELQPAPEHPPAISIGEGHAVTGNEAFGSQLLAEGWQALDTRANAEILEAALPEWLLKQRWYGSKSKTLSSVHIVSRVEMVTADPTQTPAIFYVETAFQDGSRALYQLPLAVGDASTLDVLAKTRPNSIVLTFKTPSGDAALYDAVESAQFREALLEMLYTEASLTAMTGGGPATELRARHATTASFAPLPEASRAGSAEQSNTSILYGQKMILKLFRRLEPGANPDIELGSFLTEKTDYRRIAPFLGELSLKPAAGEPIAAGMLQELVSNEGDGWAWTLDELSRFYEAVASVAPPGDIGSAASFTAEGRIPAEAQEYAGFYLEAASVLGRRTAELHLALATPTDDDAFAAEPFLAADLNADAERIEAQINQTLAALKVRLFSLKDETADEAAVLLSQRIDLFARASAVSGGHAAGQRIRIHGDYHLGQVLRAKNDFVILDFEGEPSRTLAERRRKQSPLRDVAGMLRSFSYVAAAGLEIYLARHPERQRGMEAWARVWQNAVSVRFLRGYRSALATDSALLPQGAQADALLNAYLLEKALYELLYELNHRPEWVRIPLSGILALPK